MPSTAVNCADAVVASAVEEQEPWLHVVAGVIYNSGKDAILLARRPANKHQGNKWEFPGGKVEANEAAEQALRRELKEELGILPGPAATMPFIEIRHRYPDKNIFLDVWTVTGFSGEPVGCEGQEIRWFAVADIAALDFPAANTPIIDKLLRQER